MIGHFKKGISLRMQVTLNVFKIVEAILHYTVKPLVHPTLKYQSDNVYIPGYKLCSIS